MPYANNTGVFVIRVLDSIKLTDGVSEITRHLLTSVADLYRNDPKFSD